MSPPPRTRCWLAPTAARARSRESKRSMCQNTGSLRPSGSTLLSMMLQPISPRLSGEFSTQVDISCAAAVFAVSLRPASVQWPTMQFAVSWDPRAVGGERLNWGSTRSIRVLHCRRWRWANDGETRASRRCGWRHQDLPGSAGHPFYARLNQILDQHDFDGFVEGAVPTILRRDDGPAGAGRRDATSGCC